ncbi:phosphatase PAP2 family protein [Dietzia aerolata]|uniref:phosphatase PAP2 family protein n=1 Tax=Dietzia aerolata TaxID=595984 RepID=UPI0036439670
MPAWCSTRHAGAGGPWSGSARSGPTRPPWWSSASSDAGAPPTRASPWVWPPSTLSFPSSHATSTTAFALLAGSVTGVPVAAGLVPVMLASRLVLGVHYPSDVLAGATVGAGCAALTRAVWPTVAVQRLLPEALREAEPAAGSTEDPEEKR